MKTLRVNKNVKEIEDEGVWGNLEPKKGSGDINSKIYETNFSFYVK